MIVHNTLFQECLAEIPQAQRAEYEMCQRIADRVADIMHDQHLTRRDLARKTGKRESEITRWLTGRHNFTMRTLSLISTALNEPIIYI